MRFQKKVEELMVYVEKWSAEVRRDFNIGDISPALIREALEPASHVVKIKENQRVGAGYYQSMDMTINVKVISQDMETGLIVMEMIDVGDGEDKFQTMSPGIFCALFQMANDNPSLSKRDLMEAYKSTDDTSDATVKSHIKDREASFTWSAVNTAYGKMAERYTELFDSVLKENVDTLKADYLEFLFLAFVLGNRLGFSPRNNFHALYAGVFDLTDNTWEGCQETMKHFKSLLVETAFEKIELYDPVFEMAKPMTYFITYSTKDQVGADKMLYPRNCFMPSRHLASQLTGG